MFQDRGIAGGIPGVNICWKTEGIAVRTCLRTECFNTSSTVRQGKHNWVLAGDSFSARRLPKGSLPQQGRKPQSLCEEFLILTMLFRNDV